MNIKVEEPREKSKSRKVNRYVKAMLDQLALMDAYAISKIEVVTIRGTLTGGQLAEAERIINAT